MRSFTVEGVVIKRSNLGEADRIITLFTKSHGKIAVVARGVRKLTSRRAGSLELFNLVKAQVVAGRGELDTLAEVQVLETFKSWRKHLGRVNLAYQLCEAVDKLTADHQPHPQVFEILSLSLSQISHLNSDWKLKIEDWLLEILIDLGFWPADKEFAGDVTEFIEEISSRPYNSPKLLQKLK